MPDPHTGLYWPNWFERGELKLVNAGIAPTRSTLDWLDVEYVDEVNVPADAWYDWDATNQEWITVGDAFPGGLTANSKISWIFADDLYDRKWHDGSNFSIGDILMALILSFDIAKPESAIYDEAQVSAYEQFMTVFKGFRFASLDPLVIERYDDQVYLDSERTFSSKAGLFWPGGYAYGTGAWHNMSAAVRLEASRKAAWSGDKAVQLGVDQTNFIGGPTLELLKEEVIAAAAENYLPYTKVMLAFMDPAEIYTRYQNLLAFLEEHGHVWIGFGPMYIDSLDLVAGILVGKHFEDYPFSGERWLRFAEPKLADVDISGPATVAGGVDTTFDVAMTFHGEAYPADEIEKLVWLLVDAEGVLVADGLGTVTGDGTGTVLIEGTVTAGLPEGSTRLETVVVVKPAAIPSKSAYSFILTQ